MEKTSFFEFDLSGKVAIVTGAARGMGYHFALGLAKYGADLVVCDITLSGLEDVREKIEAIGRKVLIQITDITKISEIKAMVEESIFLSGQLM
jgi:NAD(P)-dependent dehydrogenase (short-subunit alcohol dehydrogenase family)